MPINPGLRKRIFDIVDRNLMKLIDKHFPVPGVTDVEEEPSAPLQQEPATTRGEIMLRITEAARKRVRLHTQYDNAWRYLEPYEIKQSTPPILYARCSMHYIVDKGKNKGKPKVEAFRLDRIQDMYITDQTFEPAWPIKIG